MTEKKGLTAYLIGVAVLFVVGIGIGYFIWGVERQEKPDYTKYLSKTIDYIKNMEKANLALTERTGALQNNITKLKGDLKVDPLKLEAQINKLNKEIEMLKKGNASLLSTIKTNEERLKEAANLQAEHENLLSESKTLVMQRETLQSAVDASKSFVDENDRLQGIIDKLRADLEASRARIEAIQQLVTPETEIQPPAE